MFFYQKNKIFRVINQFIIFATLLFISTSSLALNLNQISHDQQDEYAYLSSSSTQAELLQSIESLKKNTTVTHLIFDDKQGTILNTGKGKQDPQVIAALADLFSVNKTITDFSLNGALIRGYAGSLDAYALSEIDAALENNHTVTDISFTNWRLTKAAGHEIANLIRHKNSLYTFGITINCPLECIEAVDIISAALPGSSLESIYFYNFGFTYNKTIGENIAEAALKNPTLKKITLERFPISVTAAKKFATAFQSAAYLEKVSFNHNQMDDAAFSALAPGLASNTSLHSLDLSNQSLTDSKSARLLLNILSNNKNLRSLSLWALSATPLNADFWQTLADKMAQNNTLTSLDISKMQMNDADLTALANSLPLNNSLTGLFLYYGLFTKSGVEALVAGIAENYSLRHVQFDTAPGEDVSAQKAQIDEYMIRNSNMP